MPVTEDTVSPKPGLGRAGGGRKERRDYRLESQRPLTLPLECWEFRDGCGPRFRVLRTKNIFVSWFCEGSDRVAGVGVSLGTLDLVRVDWAAVPWLV